MRYPVNFIWVSNPYTTAHRGLDLGWSSKYGGKNQIICAAEDGKVVAIRDGLGNDKTSRTWGNNILIEHSGKLWTRYAHIEKGTLIVKLGQTVQKGQPIAKMGNSGYSFGNHLHFEVYKGGIALANRVNPLPYLFADKTQIIDPDTAKLVLKEPDAPIPPLPQPYDLLKIEYDKLAENYQKLKEVVENVKKALG